MTKSSFLSEKPTPAQMRQSPWCSLDNLQSAPLKHPPSPAVISCLCNLGQRPMNLVASLHHERMLQFEGGSYATLGHHSSLLTLA